MTSKLGLTVMLFFTLSSACVTTSTTSTTWGPGQSYQELPPRPGQVDWVRETVHREEGNPVGGAVVGALIGGFLFGGHHDAAGTLIGAAGGAAVGAAASQGGGESRTYEVAVRFDDGGYQVCVYSGYAPFQPGQRVALTAQGLVAM
jgi:outer membrane lipoprotein SlyB